MGLFVVGRINT